MIPFVTINVPFSIAERSIVRTVALVREVPAKIQMRRELREWEQDHTTVDWLFRIADLTPNESELMRIASTVINASRRMRKIRKPSKFEIKQFFGHPM